jgi:hypothetical protein
MEYLIVTVLIMVGCIIALIKEKNPDTSHAIPKHKAKTLKHTKS